MKKLNNKGMSIIEILLSFILVTVISGSIYSTVNAFSNKKIEEPKKKKKEKREERIRLRKKERKRNMSFESFVLYSLFARYGYIC